ncbi:deoxycytidylate deaminase [Streptomyces sp. NPDC002754]
MTDTRPDWDAWFLDGTRWLARRGDCTRRQVGAMVVRDRRILGSGYNGTRPGTPGCLDGACPRGRHYRDDEGLYEQRCVRCVDHWRYPDGVQLIDYNSPMDISFCAGCEITPTRCICGNTWPCPEYVTPGSSYDTGAGVCTASHAEQNALADAQSRGAGVLDGALMYTSAEPCEGCIRQIRNTTKIEAIIWPEGVVALP